MKSVIALSAFAALAFAAPHHQKRDVVWVTEMQVVTQTVDVTETVWLNDGASNTAVNGPNATPEAVPKVQNKVHDHGHNNAPMVAQVDPTTTPSTTPVQTTPAATTAAPPPTTTAVYVAPAPPAPTTVETTQASPVAASPVVQVQTSSPAPVAAAPQNSAPAAYSPPSTGSGASSSGGNGCVGDEGTCDSATFTYYTAGVGSCGITSTDSDYIFAYGLAKMQAVGGANPNANPMCGRKIAIKCYDGTEVTATLVDSCPACNKANGMLDLTPGLWDRVAKGMPGADGVLSNMEYRWL